VAASIMFIAFFLVIGLGVFIGALLVVIVIVVTQRQDFIKPLANRVPKQKASQKTRMNDPNHDPN
jgi:hypothetical protein